MSYSIGTLRCAERMVHIHRLEIYQSGKTQTLIHLSHVASKIGKYEFSTDQLLSKTVESHSFLCAYFLHFSSGNELR